MSSTCTKGSSLSWNKLSKTLTYNSGAKVGDTCSLTFTKDTSKVYLNTVSPGSYVRYVGNNGCNGEHCAGQNANYVSDNSMGYCSDSSYKFTVNGWRVAYIADSTAYLVSAGSPECLCTSSDGTLSINSSCSNSLSAADLYKHIDNLNSRAIKYCNSKYAYNSKCDSDSAWNMNATDFERITGKALSSSSCYRSSSNKDCGYTNDLIDNGGYYWFVTPHSASSDTAFVWAPRDRYVNTGYSVVADGGRPVLRLKSSVVVTGGNGTYKDPYTLGV